jgi:hypothetical protein
LGNIFNAHGLEEGRARTGNYKQNIIINEEYGESKY